MLFTAEQSLTFVRLYSAKLVPYTRNMVKVGQAPRQGHGAELMLLDVDLFSGNVLGLLR
jgi:hypothetical protein